MLLDAGATSNLGRPDAVPGRRATRQPPGPVLVSVIMFETMISEDRPGQDRCDVP